MDGTLLAEGLRDFFGPLFVIMLGIVGIFTLLKGEFARLFKLVGGGIVVVILLYRPDVILAMGELIAELLPGAGVSTPPAG
jgi:hypothetical protein